MSSDKDDPDYKVGYKKPPKEHQFQKNQSGNPSGARRRRAGPKVRLPPDSNRRIIAKLSQEKITIVEGGRRKRVSKQDAMYHMLFRDAFQGNKRSLLFALKLLADLEDEQRAEHRALLRAAIEYKHGHERTGRNSSGENPVYPDPRDIEYDQTTNAITFTGPLDAEEAVLYADIVAHRDDLIEEYEEELKLNKEAPSEAEEDEPARLLDAIRRWNELLPKRLRRDPPSIETAASEQSAGERLAKRLEALQKARGNSSRKKRKSPG